MKKLVLLSATALSVFTLAACSATSSNSGSNNSQNTTTTSSEDTAYKLGDTITFENSAEITINSVQFTDERNQFDETNPERVLEINYTVKNLSDQDMVLGTGEIELYVDGKKMDTYPNGGTLDTISAGRTYENAKQYYGVNGSGDFELEVKPSFDFSNDKQIVKLDIQ